MRWFAAIAAAVVLAMSQGVALAEEAQNFAPSGYVYNEKLVRWERPGQPERGVESPGDGGAAAGAAGGSSGGSSGGSGGTGGGGSAGCK